MSFVRTHTLLDNLTQACAHLALPRLDWYQATRHAFASHWVMNDGSIAKLADILGHSTTGPQVGAMGSELGPTDPAGAIDESEVSA